MRALIAAGEAVPFCKTGGLADVCGALPKVLARLGVEVSLFLPRYRASDLSALSGRGETRGPVSRGRLGDIDVYHVDAPGYFNRDGLYGPPGGEFPDNDERYAFFCRAVLDAAKAFDLRPDVLHCHDWQTALLPVYLKTALKNDPYFAATASVLTVHNMAYQGVFDLSALAKAGLRPELASVEGLGHYGRANFLKGGLVFADKINTVSPAYAREIATQDFGCSLDGVLRARGADVSGILNGLDLELWDPAADKALPRRYSAKDFGAGKAACKESVRRECGFDAGPRAPLIATVSRLDRQKGLDVAAGVLPRFLERGWRYALVGAGDAKLEALLADLARRYPRSVHHRRTFDDPFARRLYAGADMFLMPSRFEPCGLGQMIAMRYGTLPVATATGGLSDTVPPHGFLARACEAESLAGALQEAQRAFQDPDGWSRRARAAMAADFSWDKSAVEYLKLYRAARGES